MSGAPTDPTDGVCAVLVTYSDRWHYVQEVLQALARQTRPLDGIIIVANGNANSQPHDIAGAGTRVVALDQNGGSAAGFRRGLEAASATSCRLIWLLDDDNRPEPEALERLLAARACLGNRELDCFGCLRLKRPKHLATAMGSAEMAIAPDSFMRLQATRVLSRLRRWRSGGGDTSVAPGDVKYPVRRVDYAIYGGLLLSPSWTRTIGYPDDAYFTYLDDVDYTTRIVRAGGRIYLVSTSIVDDLDDTWHRSDAPAGRIPVMANLAVDPLRYYYVVRNSVFLERRYFVRSTWRYRLNMAAYVALVGVATLAFNLSVRNAIRRVKLVSAAIADGMAGRMGRLNSLPRNIRS